MTSGYGQSRQPTVRKSNTVTLDPLTPWMLVAFIVVILISAGWLHFQLDKNPRLVEEGFGPGVIWTAAVVAIIGFFIIVMPAVFLGMFLTGKVMRFELPGGSLLRAGAIAATPAVVPALGMLLPPNPVVRLLLVLAVIPIAFYIAMNIFEMTFLETLVSALFCVPLFLIGAFVLWLILGATMVGGVMANQAAKNAPPMVQNVPRGSPGNNASTAPPVDPAASTLDNLQRQVDSMARESFARSTREQVQTRVEPYRSQLQGLKDIKGTTEQWQRLSSVLDSIESKAQTLPSEKPDESIYKPWSAEKNWTVAASAPDQEVSVAQFNFVPPADARLDLKSSESIGDGLTWNWKKGFSKVSIKTIDAPDTRQQRPWIIPWWVAQRAGTTQKLFVLESEQASHQTGTLAGASFVRVESGAGSQQKVTYAGLVDGKWLVASIWASSDGEALSAMENAVKTLRKRSPGEARADPFAPQRLLARLADDPQQAAALLRKSGASLEDLLIEAVESKDRRVSDEAAKLLAEVATEKSLPVLRKLAASTDREQSAAARAALQRLRPAEFDAISMAVLDLKSENTFKKREAMKTLASANPDPKRPDVTRAIEAAVLESAFFANDDAVAALSKWATPETVVKLLPWLDENAGIHERRVAMQVLSATKDKRAVLPIVRWMLKEPDNATKALTAMGPVAEDDVLKLLRERDKDVRKNAARILQEIGTQKSLAALQRASTDSRDATAAQAAQIALETVKERVKQSKATSAPTS
jgi:HEAT repeat protein